MPYLHGYEERNMRQLIDWVKGFPIHNKIDGECCPDFSCCERGMLMNEDDRIAYAIKVKQGNTNN